MQELWHKRLLSHEKEQSRYLSRVFNDHFVIVLLVLFGALLYAYSQFVKGIGTHALWTAPLLAAVLSLSLPLGRLATLLQPADTTFLLPRAGQLRGYLQKSTAYSAILPFVLQVLLTLAAWPLMHAGGTVPLLWVGVQGVAQLLFKTADLTLQLAALYFKPRLRQVGRPALVLLAFCANTLGFLWNPFLALLIALLACAAALQLQQRTQRDRQLDLQGAVDLESGRMGSIYRFYNMFTDVPGLGGGVRRRKYLDPLLSRITGKQENTWLFLLSRGFLRSQEYLGLAVRLTLIAALLMWICSTWYLSVIVGFIFVYLLAIQLVPLAGRYRDVVFTHLYPLPDAQRTRAWAQLVRVVLMASALVIGVSAFGHLPSVLTLIAMALLVAAAGILPGTVLLRRVERLQ